MSKRMYTYVQIATIVEMHVDGFRVSERMNALYGNRFEFVLVVFARLPERFRCLVEQVGNHCRSAGRRDVALFGDVFEQRHDIFIVLKSHSGSRLRRL